MYFCLVPLGGRTKQDLWMRSLFAWGLSCLIFAIFWATQWLILLMPCVYFMDYKCVIFIILRHNPIGVLFDLLASNTALPWNVTVRFKVCRLIHLFFMKLLIFHSCNFLYFVELPRTWLASLPIELCDRSAFHVMH